MIVRKISRICTSSTYENTGVALVFESGKVGTVKSKTLQMVLILALSASTPTWGAESVVELETHASSLREELSRLPKPLAGPARGTLGYASDLVRNKNSPLPKWVGVDLGSIQEIDAIALVPGWMIGADGSQQTHGFPREFFVEISDTEDFAESTVLYRSGPNYPDPGRHPFWLDFPPVETRFVRVVAERLSASFLGFSEVFVFSGQRNVALGAFVIARDTLTENENWQNAYLTDGYTPLGVPVLEFQRQRNAFRSTAFADNRTPSWLEIEWEEATTIHAVCLVPTFLIPNLMAIGRWGQGFPAAFRIEVSSDPEALEWVTVFEYAADEARHFPNPRNVAWTHAFPEVQASRLRITATRHAFDPVSKAFYFSLAEVQVFDEFGQNVAREARVKTSHPPTERDAWSAKSWASESVVDGFAGVGEMAPLRDWLRDLNRRREILAELEATESALLVAETKAEERRKSLAVSAAVFGLLAIAGYVLRFRQTRLREANILRERIANDLHDEIGSTLGSIALNADVLSRNSEDDAVQSRLSQVAEMAREASQTMRDLVWVVDHRTDNSVNLLQRLRETAAEMLGEIPHRFEVPDPFPHLKLSPEQKRHLLLFLKEALHNALRHADASEIRIRMSPIGGQWNLAIEDNGSGFEFKEEDTEQLDRLRSRARRLNSKLHVETSPGEGTCIELIPQTIAPA
ncbi:MAG: histidine kinase [Verrucomicrobiota bacterium]